MSTESEFRGEKNRDRNRSRSDSCRWIAWITGACIAGMVPAAHARGPVAVTNKTAPASCPNVVVILADDLGMGDLGCYGAELIKTPNIDRLAAEGRRFEDAYAPTSVCSPTRYALLSGRYAWRNERHPKIMVLPVDAPLAFAPGEPTLASLFRAKGYATAAIGKWHLGFGEGDLDSKYDWSRPAIEPGPLDIGFDYFFGTAANAKNQPQMYIENRRFAGRGPQDEVTVVRQNGWTTEVKGWRPGLNYAMDEIAGDITQAAVRFIEQSSGGPFFLYYASLIPHSPIVPSAEYQGTSRCGPYGDFVQELDANVGTILDALERQGVLDETLILFTSDNGGVAINHESPDFMKELVPDNYRAFKEGHRICREFRDKKHSIYEGGLRVPFIVRWPGRVPAGTVSDAIVCLTDVFASCAALLGVDLPEHAAPDSFNALPLWTDTPGTAVRDSVVLQSAIGNYALRRGPWKLILKEELDPRYNHFGYNSNQLYHLEDDPSETNNLWNRYPEKVQEMSELLYEIRNKKGSAEVRDRSKNPAADGVDLSVE